MIEILDSPKHLVAMNINGEITAEDVTNAYKATEKALKENERISFLAKVENTTKLTLEGVAKDIYEGVGQICKLKKYYRAP